MSEKPEQPKRVHINTGDETTRGRYSNNMLISHTPEEFIVDWLLNSPSGAHLVSRIIVSPGHLKRIVTALNENLARYEMNFGEIKTIKPSEQKFH